jgi:hypothetical protein
LEVADPLTTTQTITDKNSDDWIVKELAFTSWFYDAAIFNFNSFSTDSSLEGPSYLCGHGGDSCIAGDVLLQTATRGLVAARDIQIGDRIPSIEDGEWCEVISADKVVSKGVAIGGFTADHLVVTQDAHRNVVTSGSRTTESSARHIDLVNIASSCPAAKTNDGDAFTPFSTVFCARTELSWSDYLVLYQSIMRIVEKTGAFWFNPKIYAPGYRTLLPDLCSTMLSCAANGDSCDRFEATVALWLEAYVPSQYQKIVLASYPNLGARGDRNGRMINDVDVFGRRKSVV